MSRFPAFLMTGRRSMRRGCPALAIGCGLAALLALAAPLAAQEASSSPPPFPDFKAKRIGPPAPGTKKRITVQIAPAPPAPKAPAAKAPKAPQGQGAFAWFWQEVSPALDATGPGRLAPALQRLAKPPAGAVAPAPRLQHLQDIARARGADILRHTAGTRVSPALVLAMIAVESAGRVDAVSRAGAQGLMQLMPATAARFDVRDAFDPAQNIRGAVAYLDWLMARFAGDPILVLAAYNAGENAIPAHGGVPPYAETRAYVPKVLAAFAVARGLCLTPPELASDGCVFRLPDAT